MYAVDEIIMFRNEPCRIKQICDGCYYLLPVFATDESLYYLVPVEDVGHHLRQPMSCEEAWALLDAVEAVEPADYTARSIESVLGRLLETGDPQNWVKVIKATYHSMRRRLEKKRNIIEKDKMYFTRAETLLYSELAIALQVPREQIKQRVIEKMRASEADAG